MQKMRPHIKSAFIFLSCGLLFFFSAYLYLYSGLKTAQNAETKENTIPYQKDPPEDCGMLFNFESGSAVMIFLDFSDARILCAVIDDYNEGDEERLGYKIDYTIKANHTFTEGLIDNFGGINLDLDGTPLRYTGVQVADLISKSSDGEIKRQVVCALLEKIARFGISTDDLVYIIENSTTSLTIPDCIYWIDLVPEMCLRYMIIN